MNWKTTWSLLGVAVLLFGFIWFVDLKPTPSRPPAPRLLTIRPEEVARLQPGPNDWRDLSLLNLVGLSLDRMEVRAGQGRGFLLQETNKTFYLTKPQPVRASRPKVEALLLELQGPRVAQFYTDDPRAELEPLGLQPPEAELAFGNGTNDVLVVQFGKSPGTNQSLVFARRLAQTNIVL